MVNFRIGKTASKIHSKTGARRELLLVCPDRQHRGVRVGRLRWDFYGPRALPLPEALEELDYEGPGTWYLSFNLFTTGQRRQVEFPIEFDIEVDGAAQDEPGDPTPEPGSLFLVGTGLLLFVAAVRRKVNGQPSSYID